MQKSQAEIVEPGKRNTVFNTRYADCWIGDGKAYMSEADATAGRNGYDIRRNFNTEVFTIGRTEYRVHS